MVSDTTLTLQYSASFVRHTAVVTVLVVSSATVLLAYPVWHVVQGSFLSVFPPALFVLIVGLILMSFSIASLFHLFTFARRPIVFDRSSGKCTIPRLGKPKVIALAEIRSVRLQRWRQEEIRDSTRTLSLTYSERDTIFLQLRDATRPPLRLWGRLGLTSAAEPVAAEISAFLRCPLERRPERFFNS